jgi:hypothetical protein
MANIVLFAVRFGPIRLFSGARALPVYCNQLFSIELRDCDPTSFYVPLVALDPKQRSDLICYDAHKMVQRWVATALTI